jgi:hypothetical protein
MFRLTLSGSYMVLVLVDHRLLQFLPVISEGILHCLEMGKLSSHGIKRSQFLEGVVRHELSKSLPGFTG